MSFWGKKPSPQSTSDEYSTGAQATVVNQQTPIAQASSTPSPKADPLTVVGQEARTSQLDSPYGKVRSALGPGTVIQGRLSFDSVVSIDGKLGGEIFSSKALLIGKTAVVDAKIDAAAVVIRGIVKGSVRATEKIELRDGGQLIGDVVTPALIMEEGCVLNGSCLMSQKQPSQDKQTPLETTIVETESSPTGVASGDRAASLH